MVFRRVGILNFVEEVLSRDFEFFFIVIASLIFFFIVCNVDERCVDMFFDFFVYLGLYRNLFLVIYGVRYCF